ncbi:PorP/SprF family type IX secretion system membrane protein [Pricia sp. S334]|uniref:PorP/SprF family type IX secretion system membrane protein n=1 Tax=Pricia mediterranea TaxID=3076079 RepID=A0ABU3LBT4_9FLAO|nr:PorP/SprF family type IX secretion system membrane protein [Pricia sp. S334]MDT7830678.1 PorP/SprF family type IX secretion system membrane protein [Pricia sp. S334]
MNRPIFTLFLILLFSGIHGQQKRLPTDLRQHNLTTFNASLFNPTFSVGRNNPESVAFWTRWQWQDIDANPSTLFLNYTKSLNDKSAVGAGFFQHNTGIFFKTGAAVNYAYAFEFSPKVRLAVGANLFGFVQKLADDRFQVDPNLPLPMPTETNDFILQMAPGVNLEVHRLSLSLTSENLMDYNFTVREGNTATSDKVLMSMLSYDFPVSPGNANNAFLRPSVYLRTHPEQSDQIGFYALLNTDGYYGQIGYNNFYGYAFGAGFTFFKRVTVGALMEIGVDASIQKDTSFELMASYFLGSPDERHQMVGHDIDGTEGNPLKEIEDKLEKDKKTVPVEAEIAEQIRKRDSLVKMEQAEATALKQERQRRIDSVAQVRAVAIQKARKKDVETNQEEAVTPRTGEKYQEVQTADGLPPGYYLITNVFGTKKYFDAFMADLRKKGLRPKSFRHGEHNYRYVYLQRYNLIKEARRARDSNYGGKYLGKTWIFRVVRD